MTAAAPDAPAPRRQAVPRPPDVLWTVRATLGPVYGSEDLCLLLYTLTRRRRWRRVVELGTGLGVSTVWIAQALAELGDGRIWTFDDGRSFTPLAASFAPLLDPALRSLADAGSHAEFVREMLDITGVGDSVEFRNMAIELPAVLAELGPEPIDMVFSDFLHDPDTLLAVVGAFLPRMSDHGSIFLDSASTHRLSYQALEAAVDQLNRGKLPRAMAAGTDAAGRRALLERIATTEFRLTHLIEEAERRQNSTAWIQVGPVDHVATRTTTLHGGTPQ